IRLVRGPSRKSRIHRDDLARILSAMVLHAAPPPLMVACDERPATTLEVASFAAAQLGLDLPEVLSREEASKAMSARARELRMNGKRCRSLYREDLIGPLDYPTYQEGIASALADVVTEPRGC
ncbi:MAG: hypothetical protein AAFU79_15030, partial [Myxococcota bacterium]